LKPNRFSFSLFIPIILSLCLSVQAASFTGEVFRVVDGDTIEVLFNEQPLRISLHGIDCPDRSQAYSVEAKKFTSDLVTGKKVKVVVITQERQGRIYAEVVLPDERILNLELIMSGLAWWHREQAPEDRELEAMEKAARESKKGLWADPDPTPPWKFREEKNR
jgi:micrococcal nuclease